jgi:nitrous oxide reductase accessory protein NosL
MRVVTFLVILLTASLFAGNISHAKMLKLSKKGAKISETLCSKERLPKPFGNIREMMIRIKESGACPPLSNSKLEAVAYYLIKGSGETTAKEMTVPEHAKCPVCGMFVGKYPKWAAQMVIDGKTYYFDGVKDMMKFYIFDADFPYDRSQIERMRVTDFYTLESIPAKEAFYVLGSNVYGPMGNELIPFKKLKDAENFMNDHKGKKVVRFDEIEPDMILALDGIS